MSGGFLRGGMKKQSGMFHAGLLHPIGAQCPGSPPPAAQTIYAAALALGQ